MNIIKKLKDAISLKLIISLLLFCSLITNVQSQEKVTNAKNIKTQADIDWKMLSYAIEDIGTIEEYQAVEKGTVLEIQKYYDKYFKKRSRLVKAFWDNYPQDNRHDEALYMFFSASSEPYFIPQVIPDSIKQILETISRKDFRKFKRLLPVDSILREKWIKMGNDMVASVLNSNASLERKEAAAFQLISREFRYAIKLEYPLKKEKQETNYWNRFEVQYWQHIRLLLENHINEYAALEVVADRVQNILTLLKNFSPVAPDVYWQHFFETTVSINPQAVQPGINALHKLAAKNVAAIESLKEVDYSKPLEMVFTAMDGSKVNLADLRGKVVLIDFWATYCGPCIKEMPHVRAMYDKYHNQGFEVIGIAADNDGAKDRIEVILKKTGANWSQRLDQGSGASVSLHALYKITSLPTVWLLNKEGVVVDRNARGERLEPLIHKYLGLE